MPNPTSADKAPLGEFVNSIVEQLLEAATLLDLRSDEKWYITYEPITLRACLKPMKVKDANGRESTVAFIDIDEPGKSPISEISFRIMRDHIPTK